jgi:hypothetical protein
MMTHSADVSSYIYIAMPTLAVSKEHRHFEKE